MQLRIIEDRSRPKNVLETYTFTFDYTASSDGQKQPATFSIEGPGGKQITLKDAIGGLKESIRNLKDLCESLPDLPGMSS